MTPEEYSRIKDIFLAACEMPQAERESFLIEACAGDKTLRAEVDRLLLNHLPQNSDQVSPRHQGRGLVTAVAEGAILAAKMDETPIFTAGHVVAERYRIVALVGEGAMGRVYRADDLRLNQTIALKFLPRDRSRDPAWRARFEAEVRLARQIAHPNICRVYDMGEVDGTLFISMEYIDGENLASLLRKVGRLTGDKAVDIARQLCVGVASAHIHGILHRDLKPANVMIDTQGRVCITDFGLAGLVGQVPSSEIRSGTPRYMAPEQLSGASVTVQSDIYSLGLVLYELFTGRPAFDARDLAGFVEQHEKVMPPTPLSVVSDVDPGVDAIIMSCIAKDPAARPESALAVAAALPGNDLLTAALATGHIPSPSIVASAATGSRIRSPAIRALFAGFVGLVFVVFLVGRGAHPMLRSGEARTPDWLMDKAREVASLAGFTNRPLDTARRFITAEGGIAAAQHMYRVGGWGFPGVDRTGLLFVYRESHAGELLTPTFQLPFVASLERAEDIGQALPGQATIALAADGRLLLLEATPTYFDGNASDSEPDIAGMIKASGVDPATIRPAEPDLLRHVFAEKRLAFICPPQDGTTGQIRIEAAILGGRVYQYVIWQEAAAHTAEWADSTADRRVMVITIRNTVFLLLILVALPSAFSSWKSGGDTRGAVRLAAAILFLRLVTNLLSAQHVRSYPQELELISMGALAALCEALVIGVFYLALESHVRKIWPQTLVGWSRVLIGRVRDPFVGRDILIGAVFGAAWAVLGLLDRQLPTWLGWHEREPLRVFSTLDLFFGGRFALATSLDMLQMSIYQGLMLLIILVVSRMVARRQWLAVIIVCVIAMPMYVPAGCHPLTAWLCIGFGVVAVAAFVVVRFGLLAVVTGIFVTHLLSSYPLTLDLQQWYAGYGLFAIAAAMAVATFGFVHAGRARH